MKSAFILDIGQVYDFERNKKGTGWRASKVLAACRVKDLSQAWVLGNYIQDERSGTFEKERSLKFFTDIGTTQEEVVEFCRQETIQRLREMLQTLRTYEEAGDMMAASYAAGDFHTILKYNPGLYNTSRYLPVPIELADIGLTQDEFDALPKPRFRRTYGK